MNTGKVKKRIEIFVTEDSKRKLLEIANTMGIGVATVVKISIEEYLNKHL